MHISPIAQNINFKGIIPKRFTKRKNEPDIPKYEDCYNPELKGLSVMVPVFGYRSYNNPKFSSYFPYFSLYHFQTPTPY